MKESMHPQYSVKCSSNSIQCKGVAISLIIVSVKGVFLSLYGFYQRYQDKLE